MDAISTEDDDYAAWGAYCKAKKKGDKEKVEDTGSRWTEPERQK